MRKGFGTERQHVRGEGPGSAEDRSERPGQNWLTWGVPRDCSFQSAWLLDVKRARNPSWTSPVSPDCTSGHTAMWDQSAGHSDILNEGGATGSFPLD